MRLQFLGATRQVTGSSYLLEANGLRLLIDCGMFQERRYQERNWKPFPFEPSSLDMVILTHAHLDHCGLLPKLVRDGFDGQVLTTAPSTELAAIVMRDAARIQEEDVRTKRRRHEKQGRRSPHPYTPLYVEEDAERASAMLTGVGYGRRVELGEGVGVTFHDAGHILGSAMLSFDIQQSGQTRRLVFSGDLGQHDKPLIDDPTQLTEADYLVMESTYGDREHKEAGDVEEQLATIVTEVYEARGNIVVPTFAIERAQELMYHLARLRQAKTIPPLPVFLDSPMAVNVVQVFRRHREYLDEPTQQMLARGRSPLDFPGLNLSRTRDQSKAINSIRGTCVILAGSGMCTGGRIKHHLIQNIDRPESAILFVGYQSPDTLGGQIVRGENPVRIFGQPMPVRAKIRQIHGLSAHADRSDLLQWADGFSEKPRRVFLTHGDEEAAGSLATAMRERGLTVEVPAYRQAVELD